jgi:hypothetical protein
MSQRIGKMDVMKKMEEDYAVSLAASVEGSIDLSFLFLRDFFCMFLVPLDSRFHLMCSLPGISPFKDEILALDSTLGHVIQQHCFSQSLSYGDWL